MPAPGDDRFPLDHAALHGPVPALHERYTPIAPPNTHSQPRSRTTILIRRASFQRSTGPQMAIPAPPSSSRHAQSVSKNGVTACYRRHHHRSVWTLDPLRFTIAKTESMTDNRPPDPKTAATDEQLQGVARKNRGVRFSDPEWEEVKQAAETAGITPAEFVRERVLALIRNPAASEVVAVPANLVPLIERTFRYTHMLATRMRDDMSDAGQHDRLETLIAEARKLQDELRASGTD